MNPLAVYRLFEALAYAVMLGLIYLGQLQYDWAEYGRILLLMD